MGTTLPFKAPAVADAASARRLARQASESDLAFANIFLLQEKYGTTLAFAEGFLLRHFSKSGRLSGYAFPCGEGDLELMLHRLREDAEARGRAAQFCLLTHEQCRLLEEICPGRYTYHSDLGDADYLYTQAQLAELPGAAYHAKRNHISQFERAHPHWRFEEMTPQNAHDALRVAQGWLGGVAAPSPALLHEAKAIQKAISLREELSIFGGILYVDGAPVAMSIGSFISPSVADIHYEKCLPEWKKAYPLINREMARLLPTCHFINREEDLNQPGLRQAKLSYRPHRLIEKFSASPLPPC